MRIQYSLVYLGILTLIVALFLTNNLTFFVFLLLIEAALVFIVIDVFIRYIPPRLVNESLDNCMRMDGSWSSRRSAAESRAHFKLRTDFLALFLIVALTGNLLVFFIHSEMIPLPIAFKSMQLFRFDADTWKQKLRDEHIDQEFEQFSKSKYFTNYDGIRAKQDWLWYAWPFVIVIGFAWLIGSMILIRRAHAFILREFAAGIASRSEKNMMRDLTQLQTSSNRTAHNG